MDILFNESQLVNTLIPKLATLFPIWIEERVTQEAKTASPILFTPSGMEISLKFLQL